MHKTNKCNYFQVPEGNPRRPCWAWINDHHSDVTLEIISLDVIRWISTHRRPPLPSSILSTSCNVMSNRFLGSSTGQLIPILEGSLRSPVAARSFLLTALCCLNIRRHFPLEFLVIRNFSVCIFISISVAFWSSSKSML